MTDSIYNPSTKDLSDLLVGHSVQKVDDDTLLLDNGVRLRVVGNEGCGGCSSGWYELSELNGSENVITRVTQDETRDDKEYETTYRVFVYAENKKITLASVKGDDGNGYYGTGFSIEVSEVTA